MGKGKGSPKGKGKGSAKDTGKGKGAKRPQIPGPEFTKLISAGGGTAVSDAWRRIAHFINNGQDLRFQTLRRQVRKLPSIPRWEDVPKAITNLEMILKEYNELPPSMQATIPQDRELIADLLEVLQDAQEDADGTRGPYWARVLGRGYGRP